MYSYRVEQAIRAATILHKDQVRKSNPIPYVHHLFSVALIVLDYSNDEDVFISALLHDTLEDTDYTFDELEDDFGKKVADTVLSVSEPQYNEGVRVPWKSRKAEYIKKLEKASNEALLVATADKIHNLRNIVEQYMSDHSGFLETFGDPDDNLDFYSSLSEIFNRRLKNPIIHEFNHVFTEYKNFVNSAKKTISEKNK